MTSNESDKSKKRQLNPATLIWAAIIFFFIDYFAFHEPVATFIEWLMTDYFAFPQILSKFILWLLVVAPLLLVAAAYFQWSLRGQFPGLSIPLDRLGKSSHSSKDTKDINAYHAFRLCIFLLFLIVMITIAFFGK